MKAFLTFLRKGQEASINWKEKEAEKRLEDEVGEGAMSQSMGLWYAMVRNMHLILSVLDALCVLQMEEIWDSYLRVFVGNCLFPGPLHIIFLCVSVFVQISFFCKDTLPLTD